MISMPAHKKSLIFIVGAGPSNCSFAGSSKPSRSPASSAPPRTPSASRLRSHSSPPLPAPLPHLPLLLFPLPVPLPFSLQLTLQNNIILHFLLFSFCSSF